MINKTLLSGIKELIKWIFIICLLIIILIILLSDWIRKMNAEDIIKNNNADYTNSIYVITDDKNFYEINNKQNKRKVKPFTCYDYIKYTIRFCHKYELQPESKNIYNEDECIVSEDGHEFKKIEDEKLKEVMITIGNEINSPIFETKLFKTNNHYYAFITLNTVMSIYSPDYLYYYDETKKELKYIYHHFYNEEITCIREKDNLIFGEE